MRDHELEQSKFRDLVLALDRLMGVAKTEIKQTGGCLQANLTVDEVQFEAHYFAPPGIGFTVYCMLQTVEKDVPVLLKNAMLLNASMSRTLCGMFGYQSSTNRLMFSCPENLEAAHPADLLQNLRNLAQFAGQWDSAIVQINLERQP